MVLRKRNIERGLNIIHHTLTDDLDVVEGDASEFVDELRTSVDEFIDGLEEEK